MDASTTWPELSIDDCAGWTAATEKVWQSMNGQQAGDPAKLAAALPAVADQKQPPARFVAGADAIDAVAAKGRELIAQAEASRTLGGDLAHDDA